MVINPSHFVSQNVLTVDSLYGLLVCSVVLFLKDMSSELSRQEASFSH